MNSFNFVEILLNLAGRVRFLGYFLLLVSVAMGAEGGGAHMGASLGLNKWLSSCAAVLCLFGEGDRFSTLNVDML